MFRPHSLTLDGEGKEVFGIIKFQFPPIRTIPKKSIGNGSKVMRFTMETKPLQV